ncbi:hypothetical protein NLM27_04025 [Bradyrhizobium sp. CCGB12]|uniref:hypothetical protein n=1 Tax=Bradyrhizobium sp. CCGB12 TaxID=2949632 RepID=UPI0020B269B0|nr:hypothetical protein [Bradyrhizobium sp. CCGB12]MCP3387945.1 hypothetical protein [Bradyrhizobium sp. CCGB12]
MASAAERVDRIFTEHAFESAIAREKRMPMLVVWLDTSFAIRLLVTYFRLIILSRVAREGA